MSSIKSNVKVRVEVVGYDKEGREIARREKESDLILDNFGILLAGLVRTPVTATKTVTVKDTGNVNRNINAYAPLGVYPYGYPAAGGTGTQVGVGSSSQAPARTDYNLIAQLGSLAGTTTGVWSSVSGRITFSGQISLAGGGTVREAALMAVWADTAGTVRTIMIFRDVVIDVVIPPGGVATVSYTIQL